MIRAMSLLAALATPGIASAQMSQDECEQAWLRAVGIAFSIVPYFLTSDSMRENQREAEATKTRATDTGWCRLDADQPALRGADFAVLEWRADGIDGFINDDKLPTRFEAQIIGLEVDGEMRPDISLRFAARRVPNDGLLVFDQIVLSTADETDVVATAILGGAFLHDVANAQISLGGMHLTSLSATAYTSRDFNMLFLPELAGFDVADAISALTFQQLDRRSRRELLSFSNGFPGVTGTLQVDFRSERGLGAMQWGLAQTREGAEAVAFALSGATVAVDWQPR